MLARHIDAAQQGRITHLHFGSRSAPYQALSCPTPSEREQDFAFVTAELILTTGAIIILWSIARLVECTVSLDEHCSE